MLHNHRLDSKKHTEIRQLLGYISVDHAGVMGEALPCNSPTQDIQKAHWEDPH